MPASPFRKLAPFAEAAKQQGKKVYHLNIGQPDIATPPSLFEAVRQADIRVLAYSHGAGTDSYRQKLAAYYHRAGIEAMPGVECPVPGGAFYVMAHLPVDDAERFGEWLLTDFSYENQTLMLSPANGFYQTPDLGRQQ
nr:hypothetical protein [Tanacetum cinerariifolium]